MLNITRLQSQSLDSTWHKYKKNSQLDFADLWLHLVFSLLTLKDFPQVKPQIIWDQFKSSLKSIQTSPKSNLKWTLLKWTLSLWTRTDSTQPPSSSWLLWSTICVQSWRLLVLPCDVIMGKKGGMEGQIMNFLRCAARGQVRPAH